MRKKFNNLVFPFVQSRGLSGTLAKHRYLIVGLGLALPAALYLGLSALFLQTALRDTPNRAQFFAKTIDDALRRLEHLPYVMSQEPYALIALASGDGTNLNPLLEEIAKRADAEFIFVMDVDGRTIAASNYRSTDSLVGRYYTYRPYFQDAMSGGVGRYFAVGATTGRPGYFMAEPVRDRSGKTRGVAVVKMSLEDISRTWEDSGELVFVTDAQGIILASSDPELIFGLTKPLLAEERQALEEQKQFGAHPLGMLDWEPSSRSRTRLNGTSFLWTSAKLAREDWELNLLSSLWDIRVRALLFAALGLAGVFAFAIAASVLRSAQLRRALALSDADRARLALEIEERQQAEIKLKAAQAELVRKDRLAALGQLSASITHELGQPISAMRNYLTSGEIAADSLPGQLSPQLTGLVNRMQRIVDQLRSFGRQSPETTIRFDVAHALDAAINLVRHDAREHDVTIRFEATHTAHVLGSQQNLEQVIINLLSNAIDAVEDCETRQIRIELTRDDGMVVITMRDTGHGIGDLDIVRLQEPFFSTKTSGRGMGLGLAISAQIINDMGGRISAVNGKDGGAVFAVTLPEFGDTHE